MTGVGILDKTAAILRLLKARPMTGAEVNERLGFSRSTGYRLLSALADLGFVVRTPSGEFLLGPFPQGGSLSEVDAVLCGLRDDTGESAQVWMMWEQRRACVAAVDSSSVLRAAKAPGDALPLSIGGSAAHALLAAGSPSGLFCTLDARGNGVGSLAIAFDARHRFRLAVCVSFPMGRRPPEVERRFGPLLSDAVDALIRLLATEGPLEAMAFIAAESRLGSE